jgi:hypothetical protein
MACRRERRPNVETRKGRARTSGGASSILVTDRTQRLVFKRVYVGERVDELRLRCVSKVGPRTAGFFYMSQDTSLGRERRWDA